MNEEEILYKFAEECNKMGVNVYMAARPVIGLFMLSAPSTYECFMKATKLNIKFSHTDNISNNICSLVNSWLEQSKLVGNSYILYKIMPIRTISKYQNIPDIRCLIRGHCPNKEEIQAIDEMNWFFKTCNTTIKSEIKSKFDYEIQNTQMYKHMIESNYVERFNFWRREEILNAWKRHIIK